MIEAVRSGMIFAKNDKQYRSWRRKTRTKSDKPVGLSGESLEKAIAIMASQHPEYVVHGGPA